MKDDTAFSLLKKSFVGSPKSVSLLQDELSTLDGFDIDWLQTKSLSDPDSLRQMELVEFALAIPAGVISAALYDLVKIKVSAFIDSRKIREFDAGKP